MALACSSGLKGACVVFCGFSCVFNSSLICSLVSFSLEKSNAFSLISSLACLTPLLSSSMILSVLLVNLEFLALSSSCLIKSLIVWLLSTHSC
ncbi:hypothetical protein N197_05840 [Helicobacter pylori UM023]|nr:hypothetical protein N197_05840 [Helicobacter pylori UM023]